ncbi:hypothetical protein JW756_05715 [Candidatus Woesearchaeota archaeon]|nr:hypothetical protein [Candidatus Woesearchaeota archaeon]
MRTDELEYMERALEARANAQEFRSAVKAGHEKISMGKQRSELSMIELIAAGDFDREQRHYESARQSYIAALMKATRPGEPHMVVYGKERDMAMTRLERLAKDIMRDVTLKIGTKTQKDECYAIAKETMKAIRYFNL